MTLQFALSAVVLDRGSFELQSMDRIALALSLVLFVAAAVLGLSVNSTRSYTYVSTRQLEELTTKPLWEGSAEAAKRRIARSRVSMLRTARRQNAIKARLLRYAILSEVGAVACLAVGVGLMIARD